MGRRGEGTRRGGSEGARERGSEVGCDVAGGTNIVIYGVKKGYVAIFISV